MLDYKDIRSCYDTLSQKIDSCYNRFYSKKLAKHRMVACNKDISVHLEGFEVPYIMDYLSRKILLKADTKFLFRESGRCSRQKAIKDHFASKGKLTSIDSEDIHEFCALYKRWMRTLSEPLIPIPCQQRLMRRIRKVGPDISQTHLEGMAEILVGSGLNPSLVCLIHCIFFLQQIVHLHYENAMSADALAGIFAVILFDVEVDDKNDDFQTMEPILRALIGFVEYLFKGDANAILEGALASSSLNKKRLAAPGNHSIMRSHSVPTRPRSRHVSRSDDPILLEFRTSNFDS